MKLNDIQKRIPIWYEAGLSITLRGKIGRGKSSVMESAPAAIAAFFGKPASRYGFIVIQGPLLNPPDAIGYGVPQERETAIRKHLMMLFTEPFWFLTDDGRHIEEFEGGIVLIEEADKMDVDVKKIMGEMALSRRLGPHRLPKGWLVWFAGNRASDRSGSTKEFPHLINRTMEIEVDDDLQSVLDYYTKKNVLPVFTAFAADHSASVFEDQPAIPAPWCTPRSLHQLADYTSYLMKANGGELPLDDIYREEAMGKIGEGAATALFATLDLLKVMPKFEDIVANPKGVPVPDASDAQMLVCFTLAARVDKANIAPLITYIERMPPEFTITFGRAAILRDVKLVSTPAFAAWTKRNAPLMTAITTM